MNTLVIIFLVFTIFISQIDGVKEKEWKLSKEDVDDIENQILLQNNYTVKTIHVQTSHGDIYDCINLYKQPASDHPLLNNHSFIPRNNLALSHGKEKNEGFFVIRQSLRLHGLGCPSETIPIKRLNKEDVIRVKIVMKSRSSSNAMKTHYASCLANENTGYSGAQATITTYNPEVNSQQYSAARMKLHIGPDSIETGWRVDPKLYGNNQSRLYIRTDARDIHCINNQCPGFVITDKSIPLDQVLRISKPGGPNYGFDVSIGKDSATGHWTLRVGIDNTAIGYWPDSLFQQPGLADYVEWGGEVFGVEIRPGMGSSRKLSDDTSKDAFFSNVKVMNGPTTGGQAVDPINVKCQADYFNYKARQKGNVGAGLEFLIFYGGPPTED